MDWIAAMIGQLFTWLIDLGYWGIMIGLMIEVIPSEIVLSYGGFLVSQGRITFFGAVIFGFIGGLLAQLFLYWVGRYGGRPFLEQYGKYLWIEEKHLTLTERWIERYGSGILITARFVPILRHAISIPAGIAKMSFWKFTTLTSVAIVPWTIFFVYLGKALGENWQQIQTKAQPFIVPFTVIALALMLIYIGYQRWNKKEAASNVYFNDSDAKISEKAASVRNEKALERLTQRKVKVGASQQDFEQIIVSPAGVFFIPFENEIRGESMDQMYRHHYVLKTLMRQNEIDVPLIGIAYREEQLEQNRYFTTQCPFVLLPSPHYLTSFVQNYPAKWMIPPKTIQKITHMIDQHSHF